MMIVLFAILSGKLIETHLKIYNNYRYDKIDDL